MWRVSVLAGASSACHAERTRERVAIDAEWRRVGLEERAGREGGFGHLYCGMRKKFQVNAESGYFEIDPAHLGAGLAAAKTKQQTAVRITALDYRSDALGFDATELARHTWLRRLSLDEDLEPEGIESLHALTGLTELCTTAWGELDFARFPTLEALVLVRGAALEGVEALPALRSLTLIDWRSPALPPRLGAVRASEVSIGASSKLTDIAPLLEMRQLVELNLTKLTKLEVSDDVTLGALERLHVEGIPKWTDFGNLRSESLRELELFTKTGSLTFIAQLPALRLLYFWDVVDGRMAPVLEHPSLEEVHFAPHKRHYSHKEAQLNALLAARKEGARET